MRRVAAFAVLSFSLSAQTVFLRSSGPSAAQITGATNTTPIVIQTATPHALNAGDIVVVVGVCTGAGASPANGIRKVIASADSTHFSIGDYPSGAPFSANGPYVSCATPSTGTYNAQWVGKLTPYTLGPQPLGWLDGLNGPTMRKLALGTNNGLVSLTVNGSHIATATTSYAHGINSGDKLAVWGSANQALNNGNAKSSAYTAQNITSTTFDFEVGASVPAGTYSGGNKACGPAPTPNDSLSGTQDCLRISQLAYTGNPIWDFVQSHSTDLDGGLAYKMPFDGGTQYSNQLSLLAQWWSNAAVRFLVDQSNQQLLSVIMYALNNVERMEGVNWTGNEFFKALGERDFNDWGSQTLYGLAWLYAVGRPYLSVAHRQTFLDKIYNDLDDPSVAPASKKNADMSNAAHNSLLASGISRGGTANTIQLAPGDAQASGYYVNTFLESPPGQISHDGSIDECVVTNGIPKSSTCPAGNPSEGHLIIGYDGATNTATIADGWTYTIPAAGMPYKIFATITINSSTPGGSATITGIHTKFTSELAVGDAVLGSNTWQYQPGWSASIVKSITDDTHVQVINSQPSATSNPSLVWYEKKWAPGDVGFIWHQKHWMGYGGAQPLVYPPEGGDATAYAVGGTIAAGANNGISFGVSHMLMDFVAASDDPRAIRDLAATQSL